MKYLSLFTGIGGFELGITNAYGVANRHKEQGEAQMVLGNEYQSTGEYVEGTATCIGYSEIDKYAIQIYQRHFQDHKNYGDITKINEKELPDFDLLCGGFPCQSFSIAGKRGGFSDTRGTLFFDIARILKAKKPRLLLLENVKGLLSHDEGRTFATIISTLDELGYDLQWQVLNSKNHGVPQNRERVFIVGHLRGTRRPEVFPFGLNGREDIRKRKPVFSTVRATYPGNWNGDYID
jgi:DNA (cytosine-5)-methyltransferase 1